MVLFDLFGSCDFDLVPMTLIYDLDPSFVDTYRMCKILRPLFRKLSSDIHTYVHMDRHTDIQTDRTEIIYSTASRVVNEVAAVEDVQCTRANEPPGAHQ